MTTKDTLNDVRDMATKGFETLNALTDLNLRTWERLAGRQMDAASLYLEHSMRLLKMATEAKGYSDSFKGQVEAAKAFGERMMDDAKTNMKLAAEVRDDYRAWYEKGVKSVAETTAA